MAVLWALRSEVPPDGYDAYGAVTVTDGSFVAVMSNPWGTPHSAKGNPWMFTGRQLDEETGL